VDTFCLIFGSNLDEKLFILICDIIRNLITFILVFLVFTIGLGVTGGRLLRYRGEVQDLDRGY
jgi:hypothetical protein